MAVALEPFRIDLREQPVRGNLRQRIERVLESTSYQFKAIETAHGRYNVRRVGSLALTLDEPAMSFEVRQEGLEQTVLSIRSRLLTANAE